MTACVTGLAQIRFGVLLHLLQDHGRDFRRRIFLAVHHHAAIAVGRFHDLVRQALQRFLHLLVALLAAHQALDREDRCSQD